MTKKIKDQTPDEDAVTTARKVPGTPFKCGSEWTGNANGRPKGSKHRLSEEFIAALCQDFRQHGDDVIAKVRDEKPADYLRVIASILPKDLNITPSGIENMTDEELAENLAILRNVARQFGVLVPKPRNSRGSSSVN